MAVRLSNEPCLCPAALARSCAELGLRADWAGQPNAYRCPDGWLPGEGHVLLPRSGLKRLDPEGTLAGTFDLEFSIGDRTGRTTRALIPGLIVTGCECVSPGARGADAAYLLSLADRRLTDARTIADVGYGLRHRFAGHDLGDAPDWQDAIDELWELAALPGESALPEGAEPDEPPQDLEYWQTSALQAIDDLAGRLGCRLVYDPLAAEYRLVLAGDTDNAFAQALGSRQGLRIWDDYSWPAARGKVPAEVRVLFARLPHVRGLDGSPWHAITRSDPEASLRPWAADAGVGTVVLPDDLAAEFDARGDGPTNLAALETRADARALAYYRELAALLDDQQLVFAGALSDAGLLPGPLVSCVTWSDTGARLVPGRGVITSVTRRGSPLAPGSGVRTIDPLTEMVRLTGERSGSLAGGYVQRWDPLSREWVDRQAIWVLDASQ
jgi:hypothetical protein